MSITPNKNFVRRTGDSMSGSLILDNNVSIRSRNTNGDERIIFVLNNFNNVQMGTFNENLILIESGDNPVVLEDGTFISREIWHAGSVPKVTSTDVEIDTSTSGIILRAPDGGRWRVTVDNAGSLVTTSI